MHKKLQILAGSMMLVAVLVVLNSTASADTINLNAAPTGAFTNLTVGDYVLTFVGYGDEQAVVNVGGTNVLEDSNPYNFFGAGIDITRTDGGAFTLNSAEIAGNGLGVYDIQIGSTIYRSFPSSLTTVNPDGTTDVNAVFVNIVDYRSGLEVADLNVSAIAPEPASLVLLGTGLLGIAGAARRRLFTS